MSNLAKAVSQATAGEIHRAVDFLNMAREIRKGKRDLRSKWKR